ncbi:MAG: hypothetical protein ACT4OG_09425 [Alphaproteobacteria bacterium]
MAEKITTARASGECHTFLPEFSWEDVTEPGAYVSKSTGNLYRFPAEALLRGASPLIMQESKEPTILVQISKDPFITAFEARHRCAQYNVEPNF